VLGDKMQSIDEAKAACERFLKEIEN